MSAVSFSPPPDPWSFERRNIVVVGAGQGMGEASSMALSAWGARVLCVDVDRQRAEDVAARCGGEPYVCDVLVRENVAELARRAPEILGGPVTGAVDIVGSAVYADVLTVGDEQWDREFLINLKQAKWVAQEIGGHMARSGSGGALVFISSASGLSAAPRHGAYGAAKAGLIALVRTLAEELGPAGVRANTVAPGTILTPRMVTAVSDEIKQIHADNPPLRRTGQVEDIAGAVVFLLSAMSSFVTGQVLLVDGGVSAKFPHYVPA
jgi:NAD(P)-dependent dehydrogenase (short-subunit alcohol dehydrogenase family)